MTGRNVRGNAASRGILFRLDARPDVRVVPTIAGIVDALSQTRTPGPRLPARSKPDRGGIDGEPPESIMTMAAAAAASCPGPDRSRSADALGSIDAQIVRRFRKRRADR
jgi:hypothetical protein